MLPKGLQRVRPYGFLAHRAKKEALARCRALLAAPSAPEPSAPASPEEAILALTGVDIRRCPACGSPSLTRIAGLPPIRSCLGSSTPIRAPPGGREGG